MEILNKLFMDFFNKIGDVIINNIFKVLSVFAVFIALIPFLTYYLINLHYIPKVEWLDIVSYLLCSFVIVFCSVLILYLYFEAIYSVLEYKIKQKIDYIFKYLLTTMIILPMLLIVVVFFDKDDAFVLFFICVFTYMFRYIMKNSKVFIRCIFIFTSIFIFACTNVKIVQILGIGDYYADIELDSNYVKTKIILSKLDDSQIDKTYIKEDNKVIVKNIKVLNSVGDELLLQVENKDKTVKYKPLRFNKKYADIL